MPNDLKEYAALTKVLEQYGELGEQIAKNTFLMIDLANLIKNGVEYAE